MGRGPEPVGDIDDPVWGQPDVPESHAQSLRPFLTAITVLVVATTLLVVSCTAGASARERKDAMAAANAALKALEVSPTPEVPVLDQARLSPSQLKAVRRRLRSGQWKVLDAGKFGRMGEHWVTVMYGLNRSGDEAVGVVYVMNDADGWTVLSRGDSFVGALEARTSP